MGGGITNFNSKDELIEVLNEDGVSTGKAETRENIYRQGLWHRSVIIALLNDENEVLMQQRSMRKDKFPGKWDLTVAGHIPYGQDTISAVVQETMEEIGYVLPKKLNISEFRYITTFRSRLVINDDYIANIYYDFFVLNKDLSIDKFEKQESEVMDIRFMSITEVLKLKEKGMLHSRTEWIDPLIRYIKQR